MKSFSLSTFIGIALIVLAAPAQAIIITAPTTADCNTDLTCYAGPSGAPAANPSTADIEALVGVIDLFEVYKQNVGGSESGSYAGSYETTFSNSPLDPEDALIKYVAGDSIVCLECFLLVKDGASDPNYYVFNIGNWNGTDDIELLDFWVGRGAISHVTIFATVPEPGIFLLLACGLLGIGMRQHLKKSG